MIENLSACISKTVINCRFIIYYNILPIRSLKNLTAQPRTPPEKSGKICKIVLIIFRLSSLIQNEELCRYLNINN